jgi:hypothetical protein
MFKPRRPFRFSILLGTALLLFTAPGALAQTETFEPATSGFQTELKVWTSAGNTYARVRLTFPNGGYRISDWGQVTRSGNQFTADARVERWTGASIQMITVKEHTYNLGALEPGTYTFTFKSYGVTLGSQQFDPRQVAEHWEPVILPSNQVGLRIMNPSDGVTNIKIEFYFPDTGYAVVDWGQVTRSGNEFSVDIKAERWTGESQARITYVYHDYSLGTLPAGSYTLLIKMYGTTVRTQAFSVPPQTSAPAPKILTENNSERAIALDSVTWVRLFPLLTTHNFSPDGRARIMFFVTDLSLQPEEMAAAIIAQAEDAQGNFHPLAIEYAGKVPGHDWLTQIIVRPPESLAAGDVWINISVRGVNSNKALVKIKAAGAAAQ